MEHLASADAEIERVAALLKNRVSVPTHPVKSVVIQITKKLQHALFPGYFDDQPGSMDTRHHQCSLLEDILSKLTGQIGFALRHSPGHAESTRDEMEREAADIALRFVSRLPIVKEYLESDIEAAYRGDPAAFSESEIIISYPGIYASMVYRLAHELYLLSVPLIPRVMTEHAHSVTGIDINPGATIGRYFFMDHGTGIVIGETTVIGEHVKIYQGVTLGALSTRGGQKLRDKKRHPTLEDEVTVYSGASILGGDTVIGRGSVIGGNMFITKSLPPNTRVSQKCHGPEYSALGNDESEKPGGMEP
ncbi:MAG: serine O-acetyltransferase [Treponema sp.]|nr:serine O-acetyltransferase [Treponema sp.]